MRGHLSDKDSPNNLKLESSMSASQQSNANIVMGEESKVEIIGESLPLEVTSHLELSPNLKSGTNIESFNSLNQSERHSQGLIEEEQP